MACDAGGPDGRDRLVALGLSRPRRPPRPACRPGPERRAPSRLAARESQRHVASHREAGDSDRSGQLREEGGDEVGGILDRAGGGRRWSRRVQAGPVSGPGTGSRARGPRRTTSLRRTDSRGREPPRGRCPFRALEPARPSRRSPWPRGHSYHSPVRTGRRREAAVPPPARGRSGRTCRGPPPRRPPERDPAPPRGPFWWRRKGRKSARRSRAEYPGRSPRPTRGRPGPRVPAESRPATSCPGSPASSPFSIRQSSAAARSLSLPGGSGSRSPRSRRSRRPSLRTAARSTRALSETGRCGPPSMVPIRARFRESRSSCVDAASIASRLSSIGAPGCRIR